MGRFVFYLLASLTTAQAFRIDARKASALAKDTVAGAAKAEGPVEDRLEALEERVGKLETQGVAAAPTVEASLNALQLGSNPRGPLIPALVPLPGQVLEVGSSEASDDHVSNAHTWKLISTKSSNPETNELESSEYPNAVFATTEGGYFENSQGFKTTVVKNNHGEELFKIRTSKHVNDPFAWSWSFRIVNPVTDAVLYTVNKDWVGTGVAWSKDEWRIYRGQMRDDEEVYYCVSSYMGYGHDFFHTKLEYQNGEAPVASLTQDAGRSLVGAPDLYKVTVKEGEDAALLLATAVIIDMTHEQGKVENATRTQERQNAQNKGGALKKP